MRIVITGSSSGIGRALTERLLGRGHEVWGLARRDQSDLVARASGKFRATRCDVADWREISAAARAIVAEWPTVDGVVTCAGLQGAIGRATELEARDWAATVRANLEGTYFAIRAFSAALRHAPRRAKIVCLSGGGASKARPNFSAYAAAKTGIVRLVETIAEEERESKLDINAVAPGAVATEMTEAVIAAGPDRAGAAEYEAALKTKAADSDGLGRALDLIEWLLSPGSDGISGRLISAVWDPWTDFEAHRSEISAGDRYTLRRVVPCFREKPET